MKDIIFVSYSRQQLYFAEMIALTLARHELDVWFDLQRLRPGTDWQAELHRGLQACSRLVLIASRKALKSPYVRAEWETVLQAGKPVIVVLYESVQLPPELAAAPVLDLRTDFYVGAVRLVDILKGEPAPPRRRYLLPGVVFGIPTRLPRMILFLMCLLFFAGPSIALVGWLNSFRELPLLNVFYVIYTLWTTWIAWRFVQHRLRYELLTFTISISLAIQIVTAVLGIMTASSGLDPLTVVFVLAVIAIYAVSIRLVNNHFDVLLRWLPPSAQHRTLHSKAFSKARALSGGQHLGSRHQPISKDVTFAYHYATGDVDLANEFIYWFGKNQTSADEQATSLHIVVLTNLTPVALVSRLLDRYQGRLICIVTTPVSIPSDLFELTRYQWMDYRQTALGLKMGITQSVITPVNERMPLSSMQAAPEDLERWITPFQVQGVLGLTQMWTYLMAVAALLLIVVAAYPSRWDQPILSLIGAIALFPITLLPITWVTLAMERRLSLKTFQTGFIAINIIYGILALGVGLPVSRAFGRSNFIALILPLVIGVGILVAFVTLLRMFHFLKNWLPTHTVLRFPEPTLSQRRLARTFSANLIWFLTAGGVALTVLYFMSFAPLT